jgi:hypothetical protein
MSCPPSVWTQRCGARWAASVEIDLPGIVSCKKNVRRNDMLRPAYRLLRFHTRRFRISRSWSRSYPSRGIDTAGRESCLPAASVYRLFFPLTPGIELSCAAESPTRSQPLLRDTFEPEYRLGRQLQRVVMCPIYQCRALLPTYLLFRFNEATATPAILLQRLLPEPF